MQYKDDRPENTCNKVVDILNSKFGLSFKYTQSNSGEICPSYGLMNKELVMFTNGKGATSEYALASAYGEMCERLFNLCAVRLSNISVEDMGIDSDFFEKHDKETVREELKKFITAETDETDCEEMADVMIQFVDMYSWPKKSELINCITYSKENGDKFILPYALSDIVLGTNGMAAGNSYEEAYVQAFCELIERKAIKDFCAGTVTPKKVAAKDMAGSELWTNTLKVVSSKEDELEIGAYTFEDYYDFPVAFVMILNRKKGYVKYKFGAHFNIAYAVERCVTEMVQGAELTDYSKWQKIADIEKLTEAQLLLIFKDGSGMISGNALKNVMASKETFLSKWNENSSKDAYSRIGDIIDSVYVHKSASSPLYVLQLYIPKWATIIWPSVEDWKRNIKEVEVARYLKNAMDHSDKESCEAFAGKAKALYKEEATLADIAKGICPVEKQYLTNLTLGEYVNNIERFCSDSDNNIPLNYCTKCARHNQENCIVNKRKEFCRGFSNGEIIA